MSNEVSAAGTAFMFLLDRYLQEHLAPEIAGFVCPIVARRMEPKREAAEPVRVSVPEKRIEQARPNGLEEARGIALKALRERDAPDLDKIGQLTGFSLAECKRFVESVLVQHVQEKHIDPILRTAPPTATVRKKRTVSEETKAKMRDSWERRRASTT